MQDLVSVIDDNSKPGEHGQAAGHQQVNERLIAEGYWVFPGGLADTDAGP